MDGWIPVWSCWVIKVVRRLSAWVWLIADGKRTRLPGYGSWGELTGAVSAFGWMGLTTTGCESVGLGLGFCLD